MFDDNYSTYIPSSSYLSSAPTSPIIDTMVFPEHS